MAFLMEGISMETYGLKIAFIGVSHWHVPLYLTKMPRGGVAAVSDPDKEIAGRFAEQLSCRCYTDYRELVETEKPEFVFAFAPHCQMKELALYLIGKGIPFSMEKPMGLCLEDVQAIAEAAKAANHFIAIPFVWRYSDTVNQLKEDILETKIRHMSYKFVAGPPSRYLATSKWMLANETAGGGCMTNLGVHFIDMAMYLTGAQEAEVLASSYQYGAEYDIELYATSLVKMDTGASMVLETGYAYPMDEELKRENRWTIVTDNGYYILAENQLEARVYGKETQFIPLNTDSDVYYAIYTETTLADYVNARKPRASIDEMLKTRAVLDEMNRQGRNEMEI